MARVEEQGFGACGNTDLLSERSEFCVEREGWKERRREQEGPAGSLCDPPPPPETSRSLPPPSAVCVECWGLGASVLSTRCRVDTETEYMREERTGAEPATRKRMFYSLYFSSN